METFCARKNNKPEHSLTSGTLKSYTLRISHLLLLLLLMMLLLLLMLLLLPARVLLWMGSPASLQPFTFSSRKDDCTNSHIDMTNHSPWWRLRLLSVRGLLGKQLRGYGRQ